MIRKCKHCDAAAYVRKERQSPSRGRGNGYYHPIHSFYVCCPLCYQMSTWYNSSRALAIADWNRKQKMHN